MKRPIYNPTTRTDVEAGPIGHFDILNRLVRDGHLKEMTLVELRVFLVHLACRNQGDGRSFPGLATQTRLAASSQRDLLRALKGLEAKGYIRKVVQGGGKARKVRGIWIRSSEYELLIPDGETVAPGATKATHEDQQGRKARGSTEARCANDPYQRRSSNSQLPKPRIKTPKPTPADGVDGFDIGDGKEDRETSEAVTYLCDLGVNRDTVLGALKNFGPQHIGAVAALGAERDGDESLTNLAGFLANKLRSGVSSLNGHGKKPANRNGHNGRSRIHVERYEEDYRDIFGDAPIRTRVCGEDGYLYE